MRPRRTATAPASDLVRSEVYTILDHYLVITNPAEGLWTLSMDGKPVPGAFASLAEAWVAGVTAADQHDRLRPRPVDSPGAAPVAVGAGRRGLRGKGP